MIKRSLKSMPKEEINLNQNNMLSVYEMMKEILILRRKVKLLEEGGGGGETPGIDDVLAVGQILTANRAVDLGGFAYEYENGNWYVDLSPTFTAYIQHGAGNYLGYFANNVSYLRSLNPITNDKVSTVMAFTDDDYAQTVISADYNSGVKSASIGARAEVGTSFIEYAADTHTFNGETIVNGIFTAGIIAPYTTGMISAIPSLGLVGLGDYDNLVNGSKIVIDDNTQLITYTADTHTFTGVPEYADNASASGAGLVVGTIYRTGDLMKIVH